MVFCNMKRSSFLDIYYCDSCAAAIDHKVEYSKSVLLHGLLDAVHHDAISVSDNVVM